MRLFFRDIILMLLKSQESSCSCIVNVSYEAKRKAIVALDDSLIPWTVELRIILLFFSVHQPLATKAPRKSPKPYCHHIIRSQEMGTGCFDNSMSPWTIPFMVILFPFQVIFYSPTSCFQSFKKVPRAALSPYHQKP